MAHEHVYANPVPQGLVALAVACFMFFAVLAGRLPPESHVALLLGIVIACSFIPQFMAGLMELRNGVILGGNVFLYFSVYFMLATGLKFIFLHFSAVYGWGMTVYADGWWWVPLTVMLIAVTPSYAKSPAAIFWMIVAVDLALIFVVIHMFCVSPDLHHFAHTCGALGGWFLLIAGILGLWIGAAVVNNTVYGRTVMPLGSPLVK